MLPVIHTGAYGSAAAADAAAAESFTTQVQHQAGNGCVDLHNGSASNGLQLQLWGCWSGSNQRFTFVPVSGTTDEYNIHTKTSGSCVDIDGASTSDGAAVIQWTCHSAANQRFRLRPVDVSGASNTFNLVATHSGKCIAAADDATGNGTKLVQLPCGTAAARVWQLPGFGSGGSLPTSFQWSSSGQLIGPKSDASHNIRAVKDPSVVFHDGRWHVFATTTNQDGAYSMVYLNFTDWSQASSARHYYLDQTAIGGGYKAAPQVFYFAPQQRWYLVYQTGGNGSYSTTTDISNPSSWSAPRKFYANGMPQIIDDNRNGSHWVDFWVICDSANCHLFSSDGNGHLYRSQTSVANFPNGFDNHTVIAMEDANRFRLWEASNVYRLTGEEYLLVVEAIGSGGVRYFRSWTAPAITGSWTALADTQDDPLAGSNNVTFDGAAWTRDFSHGEMIRSGVDQTLTISPCQLRYVYQGKDPEADDSYSRLPWRLGMLTQTNSTC